MHRKMTPTIVDTLAAGVVGTEYYGLDSNGDVFLFDVQGQKYKVQESLAEKVRARIKAGGLKRSNRRGGAAVSVRYP